MNMATKNKKPSEKHRLSSPYISEWPILEKGDNKSILDEIRRVFPPLRIQRENDKDHLTQTWKNFKRCLIVGVNEVTKSLEKDKLALVLVCKSTKPSILTNHLIFLSATRLTPACGLFGLSEVIAPLLGLKTVAACGFKKEHTAESLQDLIEYIVCKTPPVPSWLTMWSKNCVKKETTWEHLPKRTVETEKRRDQNMIESSNDSYLKYPDDVLKHKRADECNYFKPYVKTLHPSGKTRKKRTKVKSVNK